MGTADLRFSYLSNHFLSKEQYYTFTNADLFSDIGGYLGLFLGHSILTYYDFFKILTLKVWWVFCKRKVARKKQTVQ